MTHMELVDKLVSQLREMKHWNRPTLPKNCFNDLNTAVVGRTQRQNKLKKNKPLSNRLDSVWYIKSEEVKEITLIFILKL